MTLTRRSAAAAGIPGARLGSIEVRPIQPMPEPPDRAPSRRTAAPAQPRDRDDRRPAAPSSSGTFREESGRALATLIRLLGDFDLAEEAVQDAFVTAIERWPRDGVPDRPGHGS